MQTVEPNSGHLKDRRRVKSVRMDLSGSFRSMVLRLFPNAKIVADRFHVIKLIIGTFPEFCQSADPGTRWKRDTTRALRKNKQNLTVRQKGVNVHRCCRTHGKGIATAA